MAEQKRKSRPWSYHWIAGSGLKTGIKSGSQCQEFTTFMKEGTYTVILIQFKSIIVEISAGMKQ